MDENWIPGETIKHRRWRGEDLTLRTNKARTVLSLGMKIKTGWQEKTKMELFKTRSMVVNGGK